MATFAGQSVAAEMGLRLLLREGGGGDSIVVPGPRWEGPDPPEWQLQTWKSDEPKSLYLDVPPLNATIQDQLGWALQDVRTGEVIKLGVAPILITKSDSNANVELPIGHISQRGLHKFFAVLDRFGDSVPIVSTEVVNIL